MAIELQDAIDLVRAYRRYVEHLPGRHNQKSHANRFKSAGDIKANVARLGGDKAALKAMAQKARGNAELQAGVKSAAQAKKDSRKPKIDKLLLDETVTHYKFSSNDLDILTNGNRHLRAELLLHTGSSEKDGIISVPKSKSATLVNNSKRTGIPVFKRKLAPKTDKITIDNLVKNKFNFVYDEDGMGWYKLNSKLTDGQWRKVGKFFEKHEGDFFVRGWVTRNPDKVSDVLAQNGDWTDS